MNKIISILIITILLITNLVYAEVTYEQAKFYEGQYVYITYNETNIQMGKLIQIFVDEKVGVILIVDSIKWLYYIFGNNINEIKTLKEVFKIK